MAEASPDGNRRPAKRVHQACEPCRRKKARCPGDKPICSTCARLGQQCNYADDRSADERAAQLEQRLERRMEAKLAQIETQMEAQMEARIAELSSRSDARLSHTPIGARHRESNMIGTTALSSMTSTPRFVTAAPSTLQSPSQVTLPARDVLQRIVELFMKNCNGQPLPLFHPDIELDFDQRDPEVLYGITALVIRFSTTTRIFGLYGKAEDYSDHARRVAMEKVCTGGVKLSTLQTLALLSFQDFTDGKSQRACLYLQHAVTLARIAGLDNAEATPEEDLTSEERRRCAMSIWLLEHLCDRYPQSPGSLKYDYTGFPPNSPWINSNGKLVTSSTNDASMPVFDPSTGIIGIQISLWASWSRIVIYVEDTRQQTSFTPLWHHNSDYSEIVGDLLEFESHLPMEHRYDRARFDLFSRDVIAQNWSYWTAWLGTQILYHTTLTLLNHPLIISLRLRSLQRCPRTFSQAATDLVRLHSNWIIRLLDSLEEIETPLTNPFLGYCIAVAATVFLHHRSAESSAVRQSAEANYLTCANALKAISGQWPIVDRMQALLRTLEDIDAPHSRTVGTVSPLVTDAAAQEAQWELFTFTGLSRACLPAETIFDKSLAAKTTGNAHVNVTTGIEANGLGQVESTNPPGAHGLRANEQAQLPATSSSGLLDPAAFDFSAIDMFYANRDLNDWWDLGPL